MSDSLNIIDEWREVYESYGLGPTAVSALLAAVENVLKLAHAWKARGEHLMKYAKDPSVPSDIEEVMLEHGADWIVKAELMENAIHDALGGAA